MSLDVLRDKIHAKADANLRQRIQGRTDPIRRALPAVTVSVPAGDYSLGQLLDRIELEIYRDRRGQNRAQFVTKFLERVGDREP